MLRVGLTGGIACGKSHVLRELGSRGCLSIDLDRVAHDVMEPDAAAYAPVVEAFGSAIVGADRRIDRKLLGARVFADPAALVRLNAIVHPVVRNEEQRRVAALSTKPDAVVVTDAALLVEAGMQLRYDRLVVVHCLPEKQRERLMARDALSRDEADARIASQLPLAEKRRFGHLEVDTSGSLAESAAAAHALAAELQGLAGRPPTPIVVDPDWLMEGASSLGATFLEETAREGNIDLLRVAGWLGAHAGSWLAVGVGDAAKARALLRPLVGICLARRGDDLEYLGVAVRSLARAVTNDAASVAAVCAQALEMERAVVGRSASAAEATAFGVRWGGALPRS